MEVWEIECIACLDSGKTHNEIIKRYYVMKETTYWDICGNIIDRKWIRRTTG